MRGFRQPDLPGETTHQIDLQEDVNDIKEESSEQTEYTKRLASFAEQIRDTLQLQSRELVSIPNNTRRIAEVLPVESTETESEEVVELLTDIRDNLDTSSSTSVSTVVNNESNDNREEPRPRRREKAMDFMKKGFKDLVGVMQKLEVVMMATRAAMLAKMSLASMIILAAITALVVGIDVAMMRMKVSFEDIKEKLIQVGEVIVQGWNSFKAWGVEKFDNLAELFARIVEDIKTAMNSMAEFVGYVTSGQMATDIKDSLSSAWVMVTDTLTETWENIKKMFDVFVLNMKIAFGDLISSIPGMSKVGETMAAEALNEKITIEARSATPEELERQSAYIKERYSNKDVDEVSPASRGQYYNEDGEVKSQEDISKYLKLMYDARAFSKDAKNVKNVDQAVTYYERREELRERINEIDISKGSRGGLIELIDSAPINFETLDTRLPAEAKESAIVDDIEKVEKKAAPVSSSTNNTNAVSVVNNQSKIVHSGPAITSRSVPGYSSMIGDF